MNFDQDKDKVQNVNPTMYVNAGNMMH